METTPRLVFGLGMPETIASLDAGLGSLIRWIGANAGIELVRFQVPSYEALARQMVEGAIQVAWLPPIVFVRLEHEGIAIPLATSQRSGSGVYHSVLLVRKSSKIRTLEGLNGTSVAWVDPLSASGYVLPRIQLAALGIDPRTCFASERFLGSHAEVVRAIINGEVDVAATFAGLDGEGAVSRRSWTNEADDGPDVRILAAFGAIPGDLIASRYDVAPDLRHALVTSLRAACEDSAMGPIAKRVFGVETFSPEGFASYDGLRAAIEAAADRGLLDLATVQSSRFPTRPPTRPPAREP
jgi:phosphate/phosphite/phosphonate ABC transporter binding protein